MQQLNGDIKIISQAREKSQHCKTIFSMWSSGGYDLKKRTLTGRLFQTVGALIAKVSPNCFTDLYVEGENLGITRIFAP